MLYLACYDIEADSMRVTIAKKLLSLGLERVQRSVFIGPLEPEEHRELLAWLTLTLPDNTTASCLVIPLTEYSIRLANHRGQPPPDWTYLAGESLTLIL